MRIVSRLAIVVALPVALSFLTGCETTGGGGTAYRGGRAYHVVAYKPHDQSMVQVKLSKGTQTVYVLRVIDCSWPRRRMLAAAGPRRRRGTSRLSTRTRPNAGSASR